MLSMTGFTPSRPHSFPKAERLLKRGAFVDLKRLGRRVHAHHFMAVFAKGAHPFSRLGVTVTKRVGNAVVRNRIKRCVREYFRKNKERIDGTWDINVIAKASAATACRVDLERSLEAVFKQINRYASKPHDQTVSSHHSVV